MRKYEYHLSDKSTETLQQWNEESRQAQPTSLGQQHSIPGGQVASSQSDIPEVVKSATYNKMSGIYKPEPTLYRNDGNQHIKSKGIKC